MSSDSLLIKFKINIEIYVCNKLSETNNTTKILYSDYMKNTILIPHYLFLNENENENENDTCFR